MNRLQTAVIGHGVVIGALLLGGCASSLSSNSFPRGSARTTFDVYYGEVLSTRDVEIEGEARFFGSFGGAVIGGAIGRGNSRWYSGSRRIQSAVGAVGGAIAGDAIERAITREYGLEIIVLLDHNETIAVVQAKDVEFAPGERVQVLFGPNGSSRVQPL